VTVSVNAGPATFPLKGESEARTGAGLLTVKVWAVEVPPPGVGFFTVTLTEPAVATSPAGTVTCSDVAVCMVGVNTFAPKFTVEPATKLVPVSVIVTPVPTVVLVGLIAVNVGAGLLTVKVCADVVPPPGGGLVTVTLTGPAVTTSAAGTVTCSDVAVCMVGVNTLAPKFTVELATKLVPVSVKVTPVPAVVFVGLIEVNVGTGLLTVKACADVVPPPGGGLVTVTLIGPAVATSVAGTVTCSDVAVCMVGVNTFAPKFTVEPAIKFVPVNVRVTPVPAVVLVGLMEVSVGARLSTVKVCADVVPPPGGGLVTVTLTGPAVTTSAAGTVTCSDVAVCMVGVNTFAPKFTVAPATKFVPVSVIVTPEPTVVLVGLIEVSVGPGLLTLKVCADVVPPPGPGLVTVTLIAPVDATSAAGTVTCNDVPVCEVGVST